VCRGWIERDVTTHRDAHAPANASANARRRTTARERGFVQSARDGILRTARGDVDDEDDECVEKTIDDHVIDLAARASRVRRARVVVVECEWEWE